MITHDMHHRVQVMFLTEKVGLQEHIEGTCWTGNLLVRGGADCPFTEIQLGLPIEE